MKTNKKYTFEELLNITTDEFNGWKGMTLRVIKNDDTEFKGVISNLQIAALSDPSRLVCGFIFTDNTSIPFQFIKVVYLHE